MTSKMNIDRSRPKIFDEDPSEKSQEEPNQINRLTKIFTPPKEDVRDTVFEDSVEEKEEKTKEEVEKIPSKYEQTESSIGQDVARNVARGIEGAVTGIKSFSEIPEKVFKGPVGKVMIAPLKVATSLARNLPSEEEMRGFEKKHFGEYLEPHTEAEQEHGEAFHDFGSMAAIPAGGAGTLAKLGMDAVVSGAGMLTKKALKSMDVGEAGQEYGKIASMLFTSIFNPRATVNFFRRSYNRAFEALPAGAEANAQGLLNDFDTIRGNIQRRGQVSGEGELVNIMDDIERNVTQNGGNIPYRQLHELKTTGNTRMADWHAANPAGPGARIVQHSLGDVNHAINTQMQTARDISPGFVENYMNGANAFRAYNQSRRFSNLLKRHAKLVTAAGIAEPVLAMVTGHGLGAMAGATVAAGGFGIIKGAELFHRTWNSPVLRGLYFETLSNALRQNAPATIRSMKKLQNRMKEDPEIAKLLSKSNKDQKGQ